ncbi:porin [Hymenobacter latericus]|uniref:porin n=1 Tax=Hymenobacter sp. YIM 151858-1 TaxID=2987688 RepID=UPI0022277CF1|nr:porin [Hymenobacter sp. YIM 151858-1]UYZ61159.1 porin [Hymenobacter sp. YIM 151858-1]
MKSLFTLALLLAAAATRAQIPTPADSAATKPVTFYGFVDAYYGYDFRHAATHERPGFLYSHNRQNEFTVNNAVLGARYAGGRVRGSLGLHAGTYPQANYAPEPVIFRNIFEAYAGFRPFRRAWLDAGLFASHIGFESAISKDNWTLSRSLMAENSPYYESGVRLSYEVSRQLTLTALVLNGWQRIRENNQAKALGTQVQWQLTDKLLLNSSTFYGNEQPADSLRRRRYFHDFFARYAVTDRLSLALVFDVGQQEGTRRGGKADTWHTGAAFVRYRLTPHWAAAARAEYYYAQRGVVISSLAPQPGDADVNLRGASLNLDYAPAPTVLVRLEGRLLTAHRKLFEQENNRLAATYGNFTSSIALSF